MILNIRILLCLTPLFLSVSCHEQPPQNQIEEAAINFSKAFYNLHYTKAKDWVTPSSLTYLSFLASNVQRSHLEQLKGQGEANISILNSKIDVDTQSAKVICEIRNTLKINPISGKTEKIELMQDTLQLTKKDNKWLVRKDNLLQNEMQNHD